MTACVSAMGNPSEPSAVSGADDSWLLVAGAQG